MRLAAFVLGTAMTTCSLFAQGPLVLDLSDAGEFPVLNHAFAFENGQEKGKPFSGEQTTESIRALADGNRIITSKTVRISRDSEGRERRETTIREGSEEKTSITISDPVAAKSYSLDPKTKTAREMPAWPNLNAKLSKLNEKLSERTRDFAKINQRLAEINRQFPNLQVPEVHVTVPPIVVPPVHIDMPEIAVETPEIHAKGYSTTHEDLGEEKIEGVTAHGTRDTTNIPAGAIGNEKAIVITSERWFAPDLGMEVRGFAKDPRYGETKVSVSHVSEAEPDHALFQVPPGYKLVPDHSLIMPTMPPLPPTPPAHK